LNLESVKRHLAPYYPGARRRTTVRHAFASARAPLSTFDPTAWRKALALLGQKNLENLRCVYCDGAAQSWDHLEALVLRSASSGHGHTIGNLVPACRDCNASKGNRPWRSWVESLPDGKPRLRRLDRYAALAPLPSERPLAPRTRARLAEIEEQILRLLDEADAILEAA
jgi:5-methylcytosine-specific restriction endonuclease McrA